MRPQSNQVTKEARNELIIMLNMAVISQSSPEMHKSINLIPMNGAINPPIP